MAGSRGASKNEVKEREAKEAMKRHLSKKRSWMPGFSWYTLLLSLACAIVATLVTFWSAPPSISGHPPKPSKVSPDAEGLSKQITVNRSAAEVFEYVRKPSTWFEWQRHTNSLRGAIDRVLTPGMQLEQGSVFAGEERAVNWVVETAGMQPGGTKMSLEMLGNFTGSNRTELWSTYTVEGLPSSRCTVRHQLYFENKKHPTMEEQKTRKAAVDAEMREALEILRFNFHSKNAK
eukprot:TRINITY_DN19367_c0_g1_i1.p1 TRINITY_DN19367_c0_g1~~TRINITY_DN19367_c0_g1_i1.p1  ORF type:complete len:233 (+),score=57.31 TRINITY_DN19367_c0_g1_i1:187-885(+)